MCRFLKENLRFYADVITFWNYVSGNARSECDTKALTCAKILRLCEFMDTKFYDRKENAKMLKQKFS